MVKLFFSFYMFAIFGISVAQKNSPINAIFDILTRFGEIEKNVKNNPNISTICKESLTSMRDGILDPMNNIWAMQMLDATGKLPAGIMQISFAFVGSYDQCLAVDAPSFRGQFCTLGIQMADNETLQSSKGSYFGGIGKMTAQYGSGGNGGAFQPQWDVCFPSTCSPEEILITMNTVAGALGIPFKFKMIKCEVEEETKLDSAQIVSIVILCLLGLVLLLGTLIDLAMIVRRKLLPDIQPEIEKGLPAKFFLSFSLYNNAKKMLNTKTSSDNLGAINGIRFLSMTWIILGHTYTFMSFILIGNVTTVLDYFKSFAFQVVMNGTVSVDVFFFLSGLLLAYVSLKEVKKRGKMNWFRFYFHRFWRLTPAYGLAILCVFLMPLFGSGPYWKLSWQKTVDDCKTNWWTSLLYINNFYEMNEMCFGHGWYMSNDMQFFVLSPLILFFLFRKPIVGLLVNTLFMVATMITPAILVMEKGYPPTLLPVTGVGNTLEYMQYVYIKPYCRMATYCIGVYIGFLLASKKRFNIHPIVQAILWSLSIAASTAVVYGTYEWNKGNPSKSKQVDALFVATNRPAFTLGIAWMTYACCTGYGGIVNRILSWKAFIPLGRMTFMAYLFHPYVMYFLNASLRERIIISHYYMVVNFLGFLVISYGVAFVASICFETPLLNLEKLLLRAPAQNEGKKIHAGVEDEANTDKKIANGGNENPAFKIEEEKF